MFVRTADTADVDAIVALWSAAGLGGGLHVDAEEIRRRLAMEDDYFLVGEVDDAIIASVMGCYDGHRGHIKRVAVSPDCVGQGLGQQIMDEVEARFRANGVLKLRLAVWDSNDRALSFWQAAGWTELDQIRYFTKDLPPTAPAS